MAAARLTDLYTAHHLALVDHIARTGQLPAHLEPEDLAQEVWLILAEHPAVIPHPADAFAVLAATADGLLGEITNPLAPAEETTTVGVAA